MINNKWQKVLAITSAACITIIAAPPVLAQHKDHENQTKQIQEVKGTATEIERIGDPYVLDTCPISGEKLGQMGDPIIKLYNNREVRFCCKSCIKTFEKDVKSGLQKIDEQIIRQQMELYPLNTCIISGEKLQSGAMGDPIDYVYYNRLVRFCCKGCVKKFEKDPEKYLAIIDEAIIEQQSQDYSLKTCPVSNKELGGMGESINKVYGNRLIKFCCKGCVKKFEKDPAKFLVAFMDK